MTRVALAAAVVLGLVQFVGPSEAADVRMYVRHEVDQLRGAPNSACVL
jgi:hypothetical protein